MKFFVRGVCVLVLLFALAGIVFTQSNQPEQGHEKGKAKRLETRFLPRQWFRLFIGPH